MNTARISKEIDLTLEELEIIKVARYVVDDLEELKLLGQRELELADYLIALYTDQYIRKYAVPENPDLLH